MTLYVCYSRVLQLDVCGKGSGLVFKAHRLLHHSTLALREVKKRRRFRVEGLTLADRLLGVITWAVKAHGPLTGVPGS